MRSTAKRYSQTGRPPRNRVETATVTEAESADSAVSVSFYSIFLSIKLGGKILILLPKSEIPGDPERCKGMDLTGRGAGSERDWHYRQAATMCYSVGITCAVCN